VRIALIVVMLFLACAREESPASVRTADVSIVVDDTVAALEAVTRRAESIGGYVMASHVWRDGETLRATLTIRVPSRQLTSTVAVVRRLATRVEGETIVTTKLKR
jgi:glycine cleavage system regulatory protein